MTAKITVTYSKSDTSYGFLCSADSPLSVAATSGSMVEVVGAAFADADRLELLVKPGPGMSVRKVDLVASPGFAAVVSTSGTRFTFEGAALAALQKESVTLLLNIVDKGRPAFRIKLPPPSSTRIEIPCPPQPDKIKAPVPYKPDARQRHGTAQGEVPPSDRLPH